MTTNDNSAIEPGCTLGMLGGGQLGRMFALAAAQMGYRVSVFDPNDPSPAGEVAYRHLRASYDDKAALQEFGQECKVVTTEFENIPASILEYLQNFSIVCPNPNAVHITQNRIREKEFINQLGVLTSKFIAVNSRSDIELSAELRWPCVMKTAQFGYDGKGQNVVNSQREALVVYEWMKEVPCILEEKIQLEKEISVVLGRNVHGEICFFPSAANEHRNGILHMSVVPAQISDEIQTKACEIAQHIAEALDYIGILTIEYFIDRDQQLLVNEIAPRVHNSGHYTMDACYVSQFEQQVRMICGWPPADTRIHSAVAMVNILGDAWKNDRLPVHVLLDNVNVYLHLYGKQGAKPGRKMGHFNVLAENVSDARALAEYVYDQLMGAE